jgi:hypothetical protein
MSVLLFIRVGWGWLAAVGLTVVNICSGRVGKRKPIRTSRPLTWKVFVNPLVLRIWVVLTPLPAPGAPSSHTSSRGTRKLWPYFSSNRRQADSNIRRLSILVPAIHTRMFGVSCAQQPHASGVVCCPLYKGTGRTARFDLALFDCIPLLQTRCGTCHSQGSIWISSSTHRRPPGRRWGGRRAIAGADAAGAAPAAAVRQAAAPQPSRRRAPRCASPAFRAAAEGFRSSMPMRESALETAGGPVVPAKLAGVSARSRCQRDSLSAT